MIFFLQLQFLNVHSDRKTVKQDQPAFVVISMVVSQFKQRFLSAAWSSDWLGGVTKRYLLSLNT